MATITGSTFSDTENDTVGTSDYYDMLAGNDSVFAGGGNDTVYGGSGRDSLLGQTGNDHLYGGDNADSIYGGDGDDTLFGGSDGGAGDDSLFGGAGFDYANYASVTGSLTVNLALGTGSGEGTDFLAGIEGVVGGSGADNITGDGNANRLIGGGGSDTLSGGLGNDTIEGGLGDDSLVGGDGTDTLSYANSATGVIASLATGTATGQGTDTFTTFENLTGSALADNLTGNGGANVIVGGIGNDIIDGGAGDDTITAGPELGTIAGTTPVSLDLNWNLAADDEVSLAGGFVQDTGGINVTVSYSGGQPGATFTAESTGSTAGGERDFPIYVAGGETFNPNSSAELFRTGGSATSSSVTMDFSSVAGSGYLDEVTNVRFRISDIDLSGFTDVVTVRAYDAEGNEIAVTITETSGSLSVSGNTVTAGGGAVNPNSVNGSALFEVAGPVSYIVVSYSDLNNAPQAIFVSDVQFQAIPVIDNDSVQGGTGNDVISGGSGNDTIDGGTENDSLFGGSGNDNLIGAAGNDVLDGGAGNDSLFGGADADSISGGLGNDTIQFGSGNDSVFGGDGNDLIDDVGGLQLAGDNRVEGGAGNDTIFTGQGNDSVFGDAGNDELHGEDGNDQLFGGADRDSVFGEDGNDTIVGGTGIDTLSGGIGNDVFVAVAADVTGGLVPELIFGGGVPFPSPANDFDTIDLSTIGWNRIVIVYDGGNDPTTESGTITIYTDSTETVVLGTIQFTDIESIIPCFTPGTMIMTAVGEVPVETLRAGDLVMTRDHGLQPLRWVGRRDLSLTDLLVQPDLQPVRIAQSALGDSSPSRDMMVSPQHRILLEGARAEILFGEAEVLVAAKHLVGCNGVAQSVPAEGVSYIHLLFDRHEIVQSNGLWTESFQPADRTLSAMDAAARGEVIELFPALAANDNAYVSARLSLKAHEAKVLLSV